jgi:hypothetical protein
MTRFTVFWLPSAWRVQRQWNPSDVRLLIVFYLIVAAMMTNQQMPLLDREKFKSYETINKLLRSFVDNVPLILST